MIKKPLLNYPWGRSLGWKIISALWGLPLAALLALIYGLLVLLLWNWLMPVIFGLPLIGYWQAWGLVFLAHILFKPQHLPGHGRLEGYWKQKTKLGPRLARRETRPGEREV